MIEANRSALPRRRSALSIVMDPGRYGAEDYRGPGVLFSERHPLTMVQIEATPLATDALRNAVAPVLGGLHCTVPNTSRSIGELRLLWTAPERWLAVEPERRELAGILDPLLAAVGATSVDLSHARTCLRLAGRSARSLLMKGGSLDWHPRAFKREHCAQTSLFHVPALVDCRGSETFDLFVPRGLARSCWQSLAEAAAEYGYRID